MNCPNCNAVLMPGQTQCGVCGATFGAPTAPQNAQTTPSAPVVAPTAPQPAPYASLASIQPVYQPSAKDRGLSKAKFLKEEATKETKTKALAAWISFAVLAIFIVVSMITIFTTPFYKLPVIALIAGDEEIDSAEDELDSLSDEIEYYADEFENIADDLEDEGELDSSEVKAIEKFFEKAQKLTDDATASALIDVVHAYDELADELPEDIKDEIGLDNIDLGDFTDISEILDIVVSVIVGFAVFLILLCLLGGAFKLTAMPVLVLLFYWPFTLALTGLVPTIIFFVICITFAVMCSGFNKQYKAATQGVAQPAAAPYTYQ